MTEIMMISGIIAAMLLPFILLIGGPAAAVWLICRTCVRKEDI
ncbi:hypothetical protein [Thiohalomonas denitrificans]|uniref:Uncharacterized protein n=1 Tax=Thiohalomonas denitrificans TaxID=415747 RepID=A0A1G5QR57_9GAMM|nr:hypothetical protein [Thiohalomonas denitrificans]SCZ64068.1 hypothetical protein SAMN03097708_02557 [Thiohalomonas denitrificans]